MDRVLLQQIQGLITAVGLVQITMFGLLGAVLVMFELLRWQRLRKQDEKIARLMDRVEKVAAEGSSRR
jgi:hypothetical protein